MEIRDVIHGSITIERRELPIIDSTYFQRLREIKQLGFAEHSFPGATHNRYIHSIGTMKIASTAFETIFHKASQERFRAVTRLAALLHDIGHGPLSHTSELAMPDAKDLNIPGLTKPRGRKATHEDYTLKIILDSGLTPLLEKAGKDLSITPTHIAALIAPEIQTNDDFFIDTLNGERADFRPILQQLISSELDADRMDYLRRDSLHAGVSYGQFDLDWIIANLTAHIHKGRCYLALQHRAIYAFEDFLISRFHMFLMVYFHFKTIVFDAMLAQYLNNNSDYTIPTDIETYCQYTDAQLQNHLAKSDNPWAKRITKKQPYRMLLELHSGIPATKTAATEQQRLLSKTIKDLDQQGIHYLPATSTGQLSKYFGKQGDSIFVRYDNHLSAPDCIPLEKCTDLFKRYSESRSITRLYVAPENLEKCRKTLQATAPLKYEDE